MAGSIRDIRHFTDDLKQFINDVSNMAPFEVAAVVLEKITSMPGFPYDTGRLHSSGFAYAGGKLVATSDRGLCEDRPPRISRPPNYATVIFKAVRRAKDGANVYYAAAGGKFFDYAPYVFARYGMSFFNAAIQPEVLNPALDKATRLAWSKLK